MRKQSYEFNPSSMGINPVWASLDSFDRGVFRDIIDLIWLSEKQYRMPYDPADLSVALGIPKDKLEVVLAKLMMGENPLLVEEFDLEAEGGFFISSPMLREQVTDYQRWLREERHRVALKNKDREQALSLVSRINQSKSPQKPHVAYLKPECRDLSQYYGWLPTDRFESQGQVYYLRDSFLEMLKESYPDEDVDHQILEIHTWLSKNRFRRKKLAMMNRFIINWLENQTEFKENGHKKSSEVEEELDRLLGLSDSKAASV